MTLRTRLVVAVAVLFAAIAVTGYFVTATQRRFLEEQMDEQLYAASGSMLRTNFRFAGPPPSSGEGDRSPPGTPTTAGPPTSPVGSLSSVPPAAGSSPDPTVSTAVPAPTAPSTTTPSPLPSERDRATDRNPLSRFWVGQIGADGNLERRIVPGLGPTADPVVDPDRVARSVATHTAFDADSNDGSTQFRVVAQTTSEGTIVVTGMPLDEVRQAGRQLATDLFVGAAVMVAVVALLSWWVWRLSLRPIRQITEAADAIRLGDRDRRVEQFPERTEVGRMSAALNTMLDERQSVEDGLRRFVGDASHELRTPLTSIHGYVELYERGAFRDEGELEDALRRIAQESARMMGLVDDLLLLARLDQARPIAEEPVDLALVLRDAASDGAAIAPNRHFAVTLAGGPDVEIGAGVDPIDQPPASNGAAPADGLVVTGDEQRVRQVVAAVVTNALVHTPPDASVELCGRRAADGSVQVEITDDGPGMEPEVADHALERFYRGDPSRTRDRGGSGLGLAIVDSIMTIHGGRVELDTAPGAGTTVRLTFPG